MSYTTSFKIELNDLSNLSDKHLLVQLAEDGIRLLGMHPDGQPLFIESVKFDPVEEEQAPLQDWVRDQKEWVNRWERLIVLHQTSQSVLVPSALYGNENAKELLDCQFGDLFKGTMLTDQHADGNHYTLYRMPRETYNGIADLHPNTRHIHQLTAWMQHLSKMEHPEEGVLYLVIDQQRLFLALYNKGWKIFQQYIYQTPDDVSYLVLRALEAEGLSPATTRVEWSGWMDTESALYLDLYKYLGNLVQTGVPDGIELNDRHLQGMPVHFFTPLIQSGLCVL
ncbi:MAG TPA: DUF3822 family protein [Flavihumibacter sp.]